MEVNDLENEMEEQKKALEMGDVLD